jgi:hypothetical protein
MVERILSEISWLILGGKNRIQIGIFRPIRVDHTNCLQVAIKTHSFILKKRSMKVAYRA